jgi:hypothetical protein
MSTCGTVRCPRSRRDSAGFGTMSRIAARPEEGATKMQRRAVVAALIVGLSLPVLADDQPTGSSQQLLRLGDIMLATQLRHFKLWYAGRRKNWALASYELVQIRASFEDATRLYQNINLANQTATTQPVDELDSAIVAKDGVKFDKAYERLTSACNICHEAAGLGFIAIREPRLSPIQTSPFTDEAFTPK